MSDTALYKYSQPSVGYPTAQIYSVLSSEPEEGARLATTYATVGGDEDGSSPYVDAFEELEDGPQPMDKWERLIDSMRPGMPLSLGEDYKKWEKKDTQHRTVDFLAACHHIYKQKYPVPNGATPDFYAWLNSIPEMQRVIMIADELRRMATTILDRKPAKYVNADSNLRPSLVKAFIKGVAYLDTATRKKYRLKISGQQGIWRGEPFDTSSMRTVFSGQGFAIWVMSPNGKVYAGNHIFGQFHHSSFLSGGKVRCGGEIRATHGRIEFISAKSGHYQPPLSSLIWAIEAMGLQGLDVSGVRVAVWKPGEKPVRLMTGDNFRNKCIGYESWGHMTPQEQTRLRLGQYDTFPTV